MKKSMQQIDEKLDARLDTNLDAKLGTKGMQKIWKNGCTK